MSWSNRKKPSSHLHQQVFNDGDKWSDNKICRLVCVYKKFPCLWNKDNPSYMDNSTRHSAYSNIHQCMDMPDVTFTEVMIKIREVRRTYVNELKKILEARKLRTRYEPRQKWFFTLHNFLYRYLDFDETSELKDFEDSASPCYQDEYDYDADSECFDTVSQSRSSKPGQISEYSKNERCGRILQRTSCQSSDTGSTASTVGYSPPQTIPRCSRSLRVDSSAPKVKYSPIKVAHCPRHEPKATSASCRRVSRPKNPTSVTVICDKKMEPRNVRDQMDPEARCKRLLSVEEPFCDTRSHKFLKNLSTPSSMGEVDSNVSLNTSLSKTDDEFHVFAKSVACQLRKMDVESAIMARNKIQNVLTDQRLHCRTQSIRSVESEMKSPLAIQKSPSPQQSVTRVIKPAESTSKQLLVTTKPVIQNSRNNEIKNAERPRRPSSLKGLFRPKLNVRRD